MPCASRLQADIISDVHVHFAVKMISGLSKKISNILFTLTEKFKSTEIKTHSRLNQRKL